MYTKLDAFWKADWSRGIPNQDLVADNQDIQNIQNIADAIAKIDVEGEKKLAESKIGEKCYNYIRNLPPQQALRIIAVVQGKLSKFDETTQVQLKSEKVRTFKAEIDILRHAFKNLDFTKFESVNDFNKFKSIVLFKNQFYVSNEKNGISPDELVRIYNATENALDTELKGIILSHLKMEAAKINEITNDDQLVLYTKLIIILSKEKLIEDQLQQPIQSYFDGLSAAKYVKAKNQLREKCGFDKYLPTNIREELKLSNLIYKRLIEKHPQLKSDLQDGILTPYQAKIILYKEYVENLFELSDLKRGGGTYSLKVRKNDEVHIFERLSHYKGFDNAKRNLCESVVKDLHVNNRKHVEFAVSIANSADRIKNSDASYLTLESLNKKIDMDRFFSQQTEELKSNFPLEGLIKSILTYFDIAIPHWMTADKDFIFEQLSKLNNLELTIKNEIPRDNYKFIMRLPNIKKVTFDKVVQKEDIEMLPEGIERISFKQSTDEQLLPFAERLSSFKLKSMNPSAITYIDEMREQQVLFFGNSIEVSSPLALKVPEDTKYLKIVGPVTPETVAYIKRMENLEVLSIDLSKVNDVMKHELIDYLISHPNLNMLQLVNGVFRTDMMQKMLYSSNIETLSLCSVNISQSSMSDPPFRVDRGANKSKIKALYIRNCAMNASPFNKRLHNLEFLHLTSPSFSYYCRTGEQGEFIEIPKTAAYDQNTIPRDKILETETGIAIKTF